MMKPGIMMKMRYSSTCELFLPSPYISHIYICRVFYLDNPDNARAHNMTVWTGHEKAIAIRYTQSPRLLTPGLTLFCIVKFR